MAKSSWTILSPPSTGLLDKMRSKDRISYFYDGIISTFSLLFYGLYTTPVPNKEFYFIFFSLQINWSSFLGNIQKEEAFKWNYPLMFFSLRFSSYFLSETLVFWQLHTQTYVYIYVYGFVPIRLDPNLAFPVPKSVLCVCWLVKRC